MTYLNAKKYINAATDAGNESDSNILSILEALGNPHKRIKYLRLAGSNGKTVCAEMLTSIMTAAGYRVGCLKMPLRAEPRENVYIGKSCLAMNEFADLVSEIRSISAQLSLSLAKAEILLAVALLSFRNNDCDLYVIECDHFGEDPSRFLPPPFATVICGTIPSNNSSQISRIRSYIGKGVQEIVSSPQNNDAYKIISETCISVNCRLTLPSKNKLSIRKMTLGGTEFTYKNNAYKLGLCGRFQVSNAILVLETVDMLLRKGFSIPHEAIEQGIGRIKIPAKFEVISLSPLMIVDSTHTRVAIETVIDSLCDFKDLTGNKIRICLPYGDLIEEYTNELQKRGYEIDRIIAFDPEEKLVSDNKITSVKTVKSLIKSALDQLPQETILLISGDYPFVNPVRYQLLGTLGF